MRAVDISNYLGPLTQSQLDQWYEEGHRLVIVQAVTPPAGFPKGQTRQQCEMVLQDGRFALDSYHWLWHSADGFAILDRDLALVADYPVRRRWLDCEDSAGAAKGGKAKTRAEILSAAGVLEAQGLAGIYSGKWFWDGYVAGSGVSDLPLWDAQPGGDCTTFRSYGGWNAADLVQYASVPGADLNIVCSEREQDSIDALLGGPVSDDCAAAINLLGFIQGDIADAIENEVRAARELVQPPPILSHLDQLDALVKVLRTGNS